MSPTTPPPQERRPFSPHRKIVAGAWPITVDAAVTAAREAGFHPTPRSGPTRVYVQRDWNTAASITPTPGGVIVKPAWTKGQAWAVAGVLLALTVGLCLC